MLRMMGRSTRGDTERVRSDLCIAAALLQGSGTGDIIDDFIIPYNVRKMGYRVLSDPEAIATEFSVNSVKDEYVRRVRLAVGSFRALPLIYGLPLANFVGLALFSHKLLRWILSFLMIGTFVSNMLVLNQPLYRMLFLCQVVFYLWAGFGFLYRQKLQGTRFALFGIFHGGNSCRLFGWFLALFVGAK